MEAAAAADASALRLALRQLLDEVDRRAGVAVTVRAHDERVEQELRVARRIQRALVGLTEMGLEGWSLVSEYEPAREIGGDFFDAFPILDGARARRLGLVIADVSGKGISAALLMAFVRPVIRAAIDRTGDPVEALERTNRILVGERRTGLFVTVLCGVLDLDSGELALASAGHELPILVPATGARPIVVGESGPLVGAFRRLDLRPTTLNLAAGDRLLLYTDGVTDAANMSGERFGDERLLEVLGRAETAGAEAVVRSLVDAIAAFRGAAEPADDVAMLVVERLGGG
jgi:sigma-B regulation protein RsbU (phosphoserine phosphatase)